MNGLSVWMWGPIVWEILDLIAHQSDTLQPYKTQILNDFFIYLQPLLPCKYCRDSYKVYIEAIQEERHESISECIQNRHLVLFVYELHNKVNRKLAQQNWSNKIKPLLNINISLEKENELVSLLYKNPPLMTVYKRNDFYKYEPINLEGVFLLLLAFLKREVNYNLLLFMSIVQEMLFHVNNRKYRRISNALQSILFDFQMELKNKTKDSRIFNLVSELYYSEYSTEDKQEFMIDIDKKLNSMISSGCNLGSCV